MEAAQYDLIVAGGGPAGSACAITAARLGAKVLLLEKDRFPRQKVCGEFVSPESLGLLGGLLKNGLLKNRLLENHLVTNGPPTRSPQNEDLFSPAPQVLSSRIFLDNKSLTLPVSPAAQSIPRFDLDPALFQAAQDSGVTTQESVAVSEVRRNDLFHVVAAGKTYTARAVVNATGRWSKLTQFDVAGKDKWLGLKAHFTESSPPQSVDLYFFSGGYCGVTPVSTNAVNACAMVRSEVAHMLEEVFAKEPRLWQRSRAWQPLFPTVTTSPLYFRAPETECDGMLLAGDSAGFIDPFAGDGISLALQSGTLAAESIIPFLRGSCSLEQAHRQYHAAYRKRFTPAFRNAARLRAALAAPKWFRNTALAFAAIPGVGKMLVRGTRARHH
ncbi:MAG TPA: NAD(P)/FAD-dependent oxidoreductase [Candidatus Angelobacter sp.]|nr:NAD(P)/FAD-dependent oxidoreductase [Candidatus Angelobacter sp.]